MNIFRFLAACLQGRILSTVDATRVHGGNQFLASHKYLARSSEKGLCDPKSRSAPDVRRRSRSYSSLLLPLTSSAPLLLAQSVCNSREYDLVLLTGLIISSGREVADVPTFSHPILASSAPAIRRLLTSSILSVRFALAAGRAR